MTHEERQSHTVPPPRLCLNEACLWKRKYAEAVEARAALEQKHRELEENLKKLRLQLFKRRAVDEDREADALEKFIEHRNTANYEATVRDQRAAVTDVVSGRRRKE